MNTNNNVKFPITQRGENSFTVIVDRSIYSTEALTTTCYKYTGEFYVHQQTSLENKNLIQVILETKDLSIPVTESIVKQFCNDLIDQQTRVIVNNEFGHIRDLIVEEAFKPVQK